MSDETNVRLIELLDRFAFESHLAKEWIKDYKSTFLCHDNEHNIRKKLILALKRTSKAAEIAIFFLNEIEQNISESK